MSLPPIVCQLSAALWGHSGSLVDPFLWLGAPIWSPGGAQTSGRLELLKNLCRRRLQLKSGIDFYDINRSQSVELLDGWIQFDYKPGRTKRMANRVSYNWGAPSRTTRGYHWSSDSWALYHRRGKSISEGMPRTTFGTGTSDRISDKKAK